MLWNLDAETEVSVGNINRDCCIIQTILRCQSECRLGTMWSSLSSPPSWTLSSSAHTPKERVSYVLLCSYLCPPLLILQRNVCLTSFSAHTYVLLCSYSKGTRVLRPPLLILISSSDHTPKECVSYVLFCSYSRGKYSRTCLVLDVKTRGGVETQEELSSGRTTSPPSPSSRISSPRRPPRRRFNSTSAAG